MAEVLERVAALGESAAARGGGYCALCFATEAERRLVSPRHLQRLVQQLTGWMKQLGSVASSLSWGARACPRCEARCAAAARALRALAAAAAAHALLAKLDTGQDRNTLMPQLEDAGAALAAARAAELRCTDVLLIDTDQPASQLVKITVPESTPAKPPTPTDIETVVIDDDPLDSAPPSPVLKAALVGSAVKAVPATGPNVIVPTRVTAGAGGPRPDSGDAETPTTQYRFTTTRKTVKVNSNKVNKIASKKSASPIILRKTEKPVNKMPDNSNASLQPALPVNNVNVTSDSSNTLLRTALSQTQTQTSAPVIATVTVPAPPAGPQGAPAGAPLGAPQRPPAISEDAVLMVLPPGAQIVSRLDGMGPQYLLLNPPSAPPLAPLPAPAAPPLAPPTTLLAPPGAPLTSLTGIAAPPGNCTVSCDSDNDSNDSICLSELIRRRDEYDLRHKQPNSNTNNGNNYKTDYVIIDSSVNTKTDDVINNSFNSDNYKCCITNVKSLRDDKSNSVVKNSSAVQNNSEKKDYETNFLSQCYITNVKSLSESANNNNNSNNTKKRNVAVKRPSKKQKVDSYVEEEARAPTLNTDRVDWEDKIPMDVISFMDATDPSAEKFLPPKPPNIINHSLGDASKRHKNHSLNDTSNTQSEKSWILTIPSESLGLAQKTVPSAQSDKQSTLEPRPLALISNVTSMTGEKSVVIDLC